MKTAFIATILAALSSAGNAFVVPGVPTGRQTIALGAVPNANDPEMVAAIAELRAAASDFSDETAHFANVWVEKMLAGEQEGMAAGLLDECLVDDDSAKCQRFQKALEKMDHLLGIVVEESY